jgi:hypothetical protein
MLTKKSFRIEILTVEHNKMPTTHTVFINDDNEYFWRYKRMNKTYDYTFYTFYDNLKHCNVNVHYEPMSKMMTSTMTFSVNNRKLNHSMCKCIFTAKRRDVNDNVLSSIFNKFNTMKSCMGDKNNAHDYDSDCESSSSPFILSDVITSSSVSSCDSSSKLLNIDNNNDVVCEAIHDLHLTMHDMVKEQHTTNNQLIKLMATMNRINTENNHALKIKDDKADKIISKVADNLLSFMGS